MITIIKRNGRGTEPFNLDKIITAVSKAQLRANNTSESLPLQVAVAVEEELQESHTVTASVDEVHTLVENHLMLMNVFDVAREYISYRKAHMPDIMRPRTNYLPSEYPHYRKLTDALHHAFWTVGHFRSGFTRDLQDFHQASPHRQTVIKRAMLAIGQIEATGVKMFWLKVAQLIPKPEIQEACITAANSEVVHAHAYTEGLRVFGVLDELSNLDQYPVLMARQNYLTHKLKSVESDEDLLVKIILFSIFVEAVSLFSQFLTMSEPNYTENKFKTIASIIQSTSKEEDLHYRLGLTIIQDFQKERPHMFTDELKASIHSKAVEALASEEAIIDWMFDGQDLPSLTVHQVKAYVHQRMAVSLEPLGITYTVPAAYSDVVAPTWIEDSLKLNVQPDFFDQRPGDYSQGMVSFNDDEDLF